MELKVEVCGFIDFLGDGNEGKKPPVDKGVANLIFEDLFETGTPGPARLGRNKRIGLKIRKKMGKLGIFEEKVFNLLFIPYFRLLVFWSL